MFEEFLFLKEELLSTKSSGNTKHSIRRYIPHLFIRNHRVSTCCNREAEYIIFVDFILPAIISMISLPIIINNQNKFKVRLADVIARFLASIKNVGDQVATIVSEQE